jgi:hypothetical protein
MNVNSVNMRFIDNLCPPALLYLLFITVQIALDLSLGMIHLAGVKFVLGGLVVYALNALCAVKLGIVSWAFVAAPFIITSLATAVALGIEISKEGFELSPRPVSQTDNVVVTMSHPVVK